MSQADLQDLQERASVKTPTQSELNTFKVLANMDFTDLRKPEPSHLHTLKEKTPSLPRSRENSVQSVLSEPFVPIKSDLDVEPGPVFESVTNAPVLSEPVKVELDADVAIEKEALLYEIELLEKQGLIKLHRQLTMQNSLDEIQYQYDRANMIISTQQTVDWAKTGIKMGSSVLEAVLKRFGITLVDGFSNNLCKDMSKFNKPLTKMYRKYWRRGTSSPEMELAMIVFGALAMTIMGNKGFMGLSGTSQPAKPEVVGPRVEEPSALKGPSMNGIAPSAPAPGPTKLPEWARNAMAAPMNHTMPPTHFTRVAPVEETFPEVAPKVPEPVLPVPVRHEESKLVEAKAPETNHVAEEPVKRFTLASPRSTRRRKEATSELNLDM